MQTFRSKTFFSKLAFTRLSQEIYNGRMDTISTETASSVLNRFHNWLRYNIFTLSRERKKDPIYAAHYTEASIKLLIQLGSWLDKTVKGISTSSDWHVKRQMLNDSERSCVRQPKVHVSCLIKKHQFMPIPSLISLYASSAYGQSCTKNDFPLSRI